MFSSKMSSNSWETVSASDNSGDIMSNMKVFTFVVWRSLKIYTKKLICLKFKSLNMQVCQNILPGNFWTFHFSHSISFRGGFSIEMSICLILRIITAMFSMSENLEHLSNIIRKPLFCVFETRSAPAQNGHRGS